MEAATDIQAFVQIVSAPPRKCSSGLTADEQFFDTFKEYQGRDFHMAGESYGVNCFELSRQGRSSTS